jgi:hypothetical protein
MPARTRRKNLLTLCASLALLAGLAAETWSRPQSSEAEPYHRAVVEAASNLPNRIGQWSGDDVPIPFSAIKLLKPNVIYSRRFVNSTTHETVSVLIVHCKDARAINGHYPPICYPNSGYEKKSAEPRDWKVDGINFTGTEYVFAMSSPQTAWLKVDNFILMPQGEIARNMDTVGKHAADYLTRFHGAAQVQFIFSNPEMPEAEHLEILNAMIDAHIAPLKAILSGVKP